MALWESSCNYWASSSSLVWQHLRCWYSAMDHKKISALLWAIRIVIGRPIYNVYCQRIGLELLIIYILLCRLSNLLILPACTCEKHKWLVTCQKKYGYVCMSVCSLSLDIWCSIGGYTAPCLPHTQLRFYTSFLLPIIIRCLMAQFCQTSLCSLTV